MCRKNILTCIDKRMKRKQRRTEPEQVDRREEIKALFEDGKSVGQVMDATGCSQSLVSKIGAIYGYNARGCTVTKAVTILAELIHTEDTYSAIAQRHKCIPMTVIKIAQEAIKQKLPVTPRSKGRPKNK